MWGRCLEEIPRIPRKLGDSRRWVGIGGGSWLKTYGKVKKKWEQPGFFLHSGGGQTGDWDLLEVGRDLQSQKFNAANYFVY